MHIRGSLGGKEVEEWPACCSDGALTAVTVAVKGSGEKNLSGRPCRLWGFPDDPKCMCGFATWEQKHGFPGLRLGVARLGSSSFKTGIQLSFVSSAVQRGQCGSKARVASTPSPAHEQSGKRCFCKGVCKALSFYS